MCTFLSASATVVPLLHHQEHLQNSNDDVPYALCIELVADRFLRRMVRILVVGTTQYYIDPTSATSFSSPHLLLQGTVIRESVIANRCEDILESICLSNKRQGSRMYCIHHNFLS